MPGPKGFAIVPSISITNEDFSLNDSDVSIELNKSNVLLFKSDAEGVVSLDLDKSSIRFNVLITKQKILIDSVLNKKFDDGIDTIDIIDHTNNKTSLFEVTEKGFTDTKYYISYRLLNTEANFQKIFGNSIYVKLLIKSDLDKVVFPLYTVDTVVKSEYVNVFTEVKTELVLPELPMFAFTMVPPVFTKTAPTNAPDFNQPSDYMVDRNGVGYIYYHSEDIKTYTATNSKTVNPLLRNLILKLKEYTYIDSVEPTFNFLNVDSQLLKDNKKNIKTDVDINEAVPDIDYRKNSLQTVNLSLKKNELNNAVSFSVSLRIKVHESLNTDKEFKVKTNFVDNGLPVNPTMFIGVFDDIAEIDLRASVVNSESVQVSFDGARSSFLSSKFTQFSNAVIIVNDDDNIKLENVDVKKFVKDIIMNNNLNLMEYEDVSVKLIVAEYIIDVNEKKYNYPAKKVLVKYNDSPSATFVIRYDVASALEVKSTVVLDNLLQQNEGRKFLFETTTTSVDPAVIIYKDNVLNVHNSTLELLIHTASDLEKKDIKLNLLNKRQVVSKDNWILRKVHPSSGLNNLQNKVEVDRILLDSTKVDTDYIYSLTLFNETDTLDGSEPSFLIDKKDENVRIYLQVLYETFSNKNIVSVFNLELLDFNPFLYTAVNLETSNIRYEYNTDDLLLSFNQKSVVPFDKDNTMIETYKFDFKYLDEVVSYTPPVNKVSITNTEPNKNGTNQRVVVTIPKNEFIKTSSTNTTNVSLTRVVNYKNNKTNIETVDFELPLVNPQKPELERFSLSNLNNDDNESDVNVNILISVLNLNNYSNLFRTVRFELLFKGQTNDIKELLLVPIEQFTGVFSTINKKYQLTLNLTDVLKDNIKLEDITSLDVTRVVEVIGSDENIGSAVPSNTVLVSTYSATITDSVLKSFLNSVSILPRLENISYNEVTKSFSFNVPKSNKQTTVVAILSDVDLDSNSVVNYVATKQFSPTNSDISVSISSKADSQINMEINKLSTLNLTYEMFVFGKSQLALLAINENGVSKFFFSDNGPNNSPINLAKLR